MLKLRVIPVLLLKDGLLVRSESFSEHSVIGDPFFEVARFNEWNVDELIYLNITGKKNLSVGRGDHKHESITNTLDLLRKVSKTCFMPLVWGGGIRSVDEVRETLRNGADKVSINKAAVDNPGLIQDAAKKFGSQAVVVSIDSRRNHKGDHEVHTHGGRESTGMLARDWAKEVEQLGAGEILLQSIDNDGKGIGYDVDLIKTVASEVNIPVIACGGVGSFHHYADGVESGATAVAAANIWHFKEMADRHSKRALQAVNIEVR